jgi:methylated-DNA-[protein]-cysteine S-methyltransferase
MTLKRHRTAKAGDGSVFARRVLQAVRRIPPGAVATYGDIAQVAGRPRAARAVGNLMRSGRLGEAPYHRVIAAGGRLGGYGGHEDLKAALLRSEGLIVASGRVRRFQQVRWTPLQPR